MRENISTLQYPPPEITIGDLRFSTTLVAFAIVALYAATAAAISTPASGAFAYDVYDIGVNGVLKGPIGFVGGVGAVAFGAVTAIRGAVIQALPALLGGGILLKADAIVTTLGATV